MKFIKYAPLALFGLFATKTLILGASLDNCLALAVLGSIAAYYEWKSESAAIKGFQDKLDKLEESQSNYNKDLETIKTHISGLRIGQGQRPTGIARG